MPYQTLSCPKCLSVDFVRMEHVITGGRFSKAFYCGRCDHEWHVDETVVSPGAPLVPIEPALPYPSKPRIRRFGPNR